MMIQQATCINGGRRAQPCYSNSSRCRPFWHRSCILGLSLISLSCTSDQDDLTGSTNKDKGSPSQSLIDSAPLADSTLQEVEAARLPQFGVGGACVSPTSAPSFCVWSDSVDIVLVGKIVDIRSVLAPAVMVTSGDGAAWVLQEQGCKTYTGVGLQMTIEPVNWIKPNQGESQLVQVFAGKRQVETWIPSPTSAATPDNPAGWMGPSEAWPLQVGSLVGVAASAISWGEGTVLSLAGESPFAVSANGLILFGSVEECDVFLPPSIGGSLSVSDASAKANDCEQVGASSEGLARRELRQVIFGGRPDFSFAAECYQSWLPESSEGECLADADCVEGQVCSASGHCIPEPLP